jgi:hypothetical protein
MAGGKETAEYTAALAACEAQSLGPPRDLLCVSISRQRLTHYRHGRAVAEYVVSTSRNPPSCLEDSLGTPTGLHRVAEKIGADAPAGTVFKGRVSQGLTFSEMPAADGMKNLTTSRILWLEGQEEGVNRGPGRDSKARYIYIHGTNQEAHLGRPNSHGCVLLGNCDVIALFDAVPAGTLVWIGDAGAPETFRMP